MDILCSAVADYLHNHSEPSHLACHHISAVDLTPFFVDLDLYCGRSEKNDGGRSLSSGGGASDFWCAERLLGRLEVCFPWAVDLAMRDYLNVYFLL